MNENKKVTFHRMQPVRYIALVGILSAAAFVLQLLEIPLPMIMPTFIKFDFSDLPALMAAFAAGPIAGVLVELIKNLLHALFSQSFGVGEISNFILGAIFVGVAGLIYGKLHTKKGAIIASIVGAVVMGLISIPSNYFIVYPVYYAFMPEEVIVSAYQAILPWVNNIITCLLVFNLPFTIVKGLFDAAICMLIYKPLHPLLKGKQ